MFSSNSRYRRSRLITTVNRAGQPIHAAELRIPPPTGGRFEHRVEEGERIDRLAHRYYRDPLAWWRIADANPAFATPDELLGRSPWATERISLVPPIGLPSAPWAPTLAAAAALAGVAKILREPRHHLVVELHTVAGEPVEVITEAADEAVVVTYNARVVEAGAVAALFEAAGFTVTGREPLARVGQPIVIPPERA
jgi:hypothetical protein